MSLETRYPAVYRSRNVSMNGRIKDIGRTYLTGLKVALAQRMAYRGDLFISAFIMLVFEFLAPLVVFLIYLSGSTFPGWNIYEVIMIQSIFLMAKGIAHPFFSGIIGTILGHIRTGTFDLLLLKPRSVLFVSIVNSVEIDSLGKLFGGVGLFIAAMINIPAPGIAGWISFFLLFLQSLVVLFSFSLIMSGTLFLWVGNSRIYEIFDALTSFSLYPLSVFSKSIQTFITVIIPIALISYFPASVLLGKPTPGWMLSTLSCLFFFIFSLFFWHRMLKYYTSAGG